LSRGRRSVSQLSFDGPGNAHINTTVTLLPGGTATFTAVAPPAEIAKPAKRPPAFNLRMFVGVVIAFGLARL
jgi:hypothetical protein